MKKITTLLLLTIATLSVYAQPYLVGHRGSYWGVENTEEAFINGAKKGYDYLETDIKVTKDGKFVCCHNDDLTAWGGTLTIASSNLSALQAQKLTQTRGGVTYTGYLTTFERYLDICKEYGVAPVIEFKWATGINSNDCSNIPALIKIVEEKGFRNNCYIFTSMQKCLQYVKTNYPDMEIMYLCYDTAFESSRSWCITNKAHIGPGVGNGITKAGVQKYHDEGLLVNAWTCNTNSSYQTYGNYGCDFITTDYLDPANLPTLSTPTTMLSDLKTDKSSVSLVAGIGETVYADIAVTGSNMNSALTVTSSNNAFTVTNNTSLSSNKISGTVRVLFSPTTEGVVTGTITLKATNKSGKTVTTTVAVTGKCSLKFDEVWNFSEASGKSPSSGTNWASDKTSMRNIAYGNGKLYTINPSASTIYVVNAQTGVYETSINTTGVSGGTFGVMDAQVVDGKLVAANLATAGAPTVKAYVWDTDNSAPREILNTTDLGGCTRVGDCMSIQGNLTNGAILFLSGSTILKYPISNGIVSTTPTTISVTEGGSAVDAGTSPRVIAQADGKYWIMGRGIYPKLVSASGNVELTLNSEALNGIIDGNDFYPFIFKGKQYAFATTYATGSSTLTYCRAVLIDASNGWANAVNVGEYPANGLGSTRNTNLNTGIEMEINGESGVELWVNCSLQGIAHYRYGAAKIHTSDPTLSVSQNSFSFEAYKGETATETLNVSGVNLEGDITLSLSGNDASQFSLSKTTITKDSASGTITVTYNPTSVGNHSATITISSSNAKQAIISLNGISTERPLVSEIEDLDLGWAHCQNVNHALPSWLNISTSGTTRFIAENEGNLYVLNCSPWGTPEINIINAYTGIDTETDVNLDGVSGGLTPISSIRFVSGTLVAANACNANHTFTVYAWKNGVSSAPSIILEDSSHGGLIMGSNIAISGNLTNGSIWATDDGVKNVLRYTISNGSVSSTPTIIPLTKDGESLSLLGSRGAGEVVPNDDGSFWVVGQTAYPMLFNASGIYQSEMKAEALNNNNHGTALKFFEYGNVDYAAAVSYFDGQMNGYFTLINVTDGIENASSFIGKYPNNGLGSTVNAQNMSSIAQSVTNDGKRLNIWVACALQGVAYFYTEQTTNSIDNVTFKAVEKMSVVNNGSNLMVSGIDAASIAIYSINGTLIASVANSNEIKVEGLNGLYIVVVADVNGQNHVAKAILR